MARSDLVDIECIMVHQTDAAYLVNDGTTEEWVPKSVSEWSGPAKGSGILTLPQSWADSKGLS